VQVVDHELYKLKRYITNNFIREPELRVIGNKGENLGVLKTSDALIIAKDGGFDLIVVAEKATPPVAKITNFKKFLYDERHKASKGKSKGTGELKEFKLSPGIGEGDIAFRIRRAHNFVVEDKNKVKFTVQFKGREIAYPEFGREKLTRIITELGDVSDIDEEIKLKGNQMTLTLKPKKL
jgi:translation initiation factor IF-3